MQTNQSLLAKLQAGNVKATTPAKRNRDDIEWMTLDITSASPDLQEAWQVWHTGEAAFKRLLNEKLDPPEGWRYIVTDKRGGCAFGLAKLASGNNVITLEEAIARANTTSK